MPTHNLAIVFGGKSTEHEISILSAKSILKHLDRSQYSLFIIKIDTSGHWYLIQETEIDDKQAGREVVLVPGSPKARLIAVENGELITTLDVAFPVLHGLFGEDGTIQGLFKMVDLAFVGCDVLDAAACMDKDVTKRLLRDAGIHVAPYLMASPQHIPTFETVEAELGLPVFIKPANLGSSVGVFKINSATEYKEKLKVALSYDHKVLIEQQIVGKEVECSVLGNEEPKASLPGEIITNTEFYDFESKYVDSNASSTQIPASITDEQIEIVRETAVKAYQVMGCHGLARVDFFVTSAGEILINEINTLPGFTNISMYPKMWEATGIGYAELLDLLIELALNKHEKDAALNVMAREVK
ncbi:MULTISPECIES: D-alanine--D-alanine ligase family protein [Roseivirga]|jgi:D-alanine-D-alanine ligase|uniref:D-alanine--D-alanine ligase n=1 Tax=Roseivirga thermotolerans TaxID=1758176 RepID=A0ABQ3I704_9BACT|nr:MULTISPECIES: D-alanine--D-alanine ligase family protein [Roseivirga]MEC7755880.1 D-alanine--D-alanine ligase family protein [Bacteroidota bacterium]GHE69313.1 D-alanine--D-alanine ligase A [Roseivirga thermotolerans]|tara:strand:- start:11982 stop:13052 length:1071 start_codon:yes stop_codon:yes gene_type:complete